MFIIYVGEVNFFNEKVFLPPHPYPSKTLKQGFYFFMMICALIGRTYTVRTNPRPKVFSQVFFKKLARVWGEKPHNYPS